MTFKLHKLHFFLTLINLFLLFSCKTIPGSHQLQTKEPVQLSRTLLSPGQLTAAQLADFFISVKPDYSYEKILQFSIFYVQEATVENINSDAAFAQMCLETGWLQFGNLVTEDMNNFCGLGSIDKSSTGAVFNTPQLGVRAHIQHLHAYATPENVSLHNDLIDPRYSWVHKTKLVSTIFQLSGVWAADTEYGDKINNILFKMEDFINNK